MRIGFPVAWSMLTCLLLALAASAGDCSAQILPPSFRPLGGASIAEIDSAAARADRAYKALREQRSRLEESARSVASNTALQTVRATLERDIQNFNAQMSGLTVELTQIQARVGDIPNAIRDAEARRQEWDTALQELNDAINRLPSPPRDGSIDPNADVRSQLSAAKLRAERASTGEKAAIDSLTNLQGALHTRITQIQEQQSSLRTALDIRTQGLRALGEGRFVDAAGQIQQAAQALADDSVRLAHALSDAVSLKESAHRLAKHTWAPLRSQRDAESFYGQDQLSLGRSAILSLGEHGNGSVTAELGSVVVSPVRLSLYTVVARVEEVRREDTPASNEIDDPDSSSIARFFAGGGTTVISAVAPFFYRRWGGANVIAQFHPKWAADVPPYGIVDVPFSTTSNNLDTGLELYASFLQSGRFQAFGFYRGALVYGSDLFYRQVGFSGDDAFGYHQVVAGLEFTGVARLLATGSFGPGDLERGWRLTLQFSRPSGTADAAPSAGSANQ